MQLQGGAQKEVGGLGGGGGKNDQDVIEKDSDLRKVRLAVDFPFQRSVVTNLYNAGKAENSMECPLE